MHFTATERRLAAMDVSLGPCVRAERQRRALVSPLLQDTGEGPDQTEALFTALTSEARGDLLRPIASAGAGRVARYSEVFLNALADASQKLVAVTDMDGFMAMLGEIDRAWMAATRWPPHYVSLRNRLHRLHAARVAREKEQPLYCWHGPSVPMRTVVAGSGPYPGKAACS